MMWALMTTDELWPLGTHTSDPLLAIAGPGSGPVPSMVPLFNREPPSVSTCILPSLLCSPNYGSGPVKPDQTSLTRLEHEDFMSAWSECLYPLQIHTLKS